MTNEIRDEIVSFLDCCRMSLWGFKKETEIERRRLAGYFYLNNKRTSKTNSSSPGWESFKNNQKISFFLFYLEC